MNREREEHHHVLLQSDLNLQRSSPSQNPGGGHRRSRASRPDFLRQNHVSVSQAPLVEAEGARRRSPHLLQALHRLLLSRIYCYKDSGRREMGNERFRWLLSGPLLGISNPALSILSIPFFAIPNLAYAAVLQGFSMCRKVCTSIFPVDCMIAQFYWRKAAQ